MFFIAGVSPRLRQLSVANGACLACKESGRLHIVKQCQSLSVFFIPLLSFSVDYIATCGGCASIMSLLNKTGKQLEKDPSMPLGPNDLQIVKDNHGPRCPHCKWRTKISYSFCPACSGKL